MTKHDELELEEYAKHILHNITPLDVSRLEKMANLVLELLHDYKEACKPDPDFIDRF
jgi:hypothetical protein